MAHFELTGAPLMRFLDRLTYVCNHYAKNRSVLRVLADRWEKSFAARPSLSAIGGEPIVGSPPLCRYLMATRNGRFKEAGVYF